MATELKYLSYYKDVLKFAKENYAEHMSNISEQIDLLIESMHEDIDKWGINSVKEFKETRNFAAYKELNQYISKMQNMVETLKEICNLVLPDFALDDDIIDKENITEQTEEENIKINYNDKRYSADTTIPHSLYENFTFTRPVAIEIRDVRIEVSEWKEMFRGICEYLYIQDPKKFYSFVSDEDMRGKKRKWFSFDKKDVVDPMIVSNSGIYIMGNVSAMFVRNIIIKMFEKYAIPKHECRIYIGRDFSSLHTTEDTLSKGTNDNKNNLSVEVQSIFDFINEHSISDDNVPAVKIGKYAKTYFEEYFKQTVPQESLEHFLNKDWCHNTFGICYPLLKKVDESIPLSRQIGYNNQYNRYYANTLTVNNEKYLLCSQWFEDFRPKLDKWIEQQRNHVQNNTSTDINKIQVCTLKDDLTNKKPSSIMINGYNIQGSTWRDIFLKFCKYLLSIDTERFYNIVLSNKIAGRTKKYFSKDSTELRDGKIIDKTDIYIESNLSSNHIRNIIRELLNDYNIPISNCIVYLTNNSLDYDKEDMGIKCDLEDLSQNTDVVYFNKKSTGFHLDRETAIDIFTYISNCSKQNGKIESNNVSNNFADSISYSNPSNAISTLFKILMKNNILDLCDGCQKKYYKVVDEFKIEQLISDPTLIQTGKWRQPSESDNKKINVTVVSKRHKKKCIFCSNALTPYRLKYNVYEDDNKCEVSFKREIYTKQCPNCKKIFITEGTYNTIKKQQKNYINKTNLSFIV